MCFSQNLAEKKWEQGPDRAGGVFQSRRAHGALQGLLRLTKINDVMSCRAFRVGLTTPFVRWLLLSCGAFFFFNIIMKFSGSVDLAFLTQCCCLSLQAFLHCKSIDRVLKQTSTAQNGILAVCFNLWLVEADSEALWIFR